MVLAGKSLETFRQSYEAHRKSTVLYHFFYSIVRTQFVGVQPYALSHQELYLLLRLYLEPVVQLITGDIYHVVQPLKEHIQISLCLYGKSRQIYRCETEVSSSCNDFSRRVVSVSYHSRPASHVGTFGIRIALHIILLVKRSVQK